MPGSDIGTNYAVWTTPYGLARARERTPGYVDPFPQPTNEGQTVANARARAAAAGAPIGAGYLNPRSGRLEDPNRSPWYSNPAVLGPIILAATTAGLGAFAAPAAATGATAGASGAAGAGLGAGTVGVSGPATGFGLSGALPSAAATAAATGASHALPLGGLAATGATAGASRGVDAIRRALTDPATYAAVAPVVAALAMPRAGAASWGGTGGDELRRIQAITEARMRRTDPLHQVATQLAYSRAPVDARKGIELTNVPLP